MSAPETSIELKARYAELVNGVDRNLELYELHDTYGDVIGWLLVVLLFEQH
jgi:hypothetical protein